MDISGLVSKQSCRDRIESFETSLSSLYVHFFYEHGNTKHFILFLSVEKNRKGIDCLRPCFRKVINSKFFLSSLN